MTRKDYELIARAVNKSSRHAYIDGKTIDIIVKELSNELSNDNNKFNSERFGWACKIKIKIEI